MRFRRAPGNEEGPPPPTPRAVRRALPPAGQLRRERRLLLVAREAKLRDLGGLMHETLQAHCLERGARLPTDRGVVGVLSSSWQRRFAWYPGDWIWPVLLFLVLTIAATGAALAAGAARKKSAPTLVATGPTVTVGPGAPRATVAPTVTSTLPGAPAPTITTGPLPTAPGPGRT